MKPIMRVPAVIFSLILFVMLGWTLGQAQPSDNSGTVVRNWNQLALDTARTKNASDAQAARLYAMVNVAIYDAVNGIASRHGSMDRDHALVPPDGAPAHGDTIAAAASAAHAVLIGLYPDLAARFDAQLASDLSGLRGSGPVSAGREWGEHVGAEVLAARANDGSSPDETQPPGVGPGQFRAAWSGTQFRNLLPFAIADSSVYVSPGPPGSHQPRVCSRPGRGEAAGQCGDSGRPEARHLPILESWCGNQSASRGMDPDRPRSYQRSTASAHGNGAAVRAAQYGDGRHRRAYLSDQVRLSHLAPGYGDSGSGHRRQSEHHRRPGMESTRRGIGGTPEHWSGHSSFAGAAARVLAGFFCQDNIPFTLVTDSAPGAQARSYPSFSAAEAEMGRSRVLGGIHFEFSNQAGITAGRGVAAEVLSRKLLLQRGPTHFGQCPL